MLLSCNSKNSVFSLNSFQQAQKDHLAPPGAGRVAGLKRSSVHLPGRQKRSKTFTDLCTYTGIHSRIQKEFFSQKERKRCLTAAAGHRACYLQILLSATHAVAIPQWGLKQGKRHQADASKLPSKWSSKKGKGGKEVIRLHPAERKNYYVSLRREVISMLIITKGNLTLPDFPTKRTQPISLLELDCFALIFNRSLEGRWFPKPFFFFKLFSGFFQSSFCSPLHWQPNIYCQRCSAYIKMEKQQSCVLILAFRKKDKEQYGGENSVQNLHKGTHLSRGKNVLNCGYEQCSTICSFPLLCTQPSKFSCQLVLLI